MGVQHLIALVAVTGCGSGSLLLGAVAATTPPTAASVVQQRFPESESRQDGHCPGGEQVQWWRGGAEARKSWLSDFALKIKQHSSSAGSTRTNNRAKFAWKAYEDRMSELTRNPNDARLQLETAEALLKWIRHTTNGNFPRVSAEGRVSDGDNPASRAIWRKHAPEALRLLKTGAIYALDSSSSSSKSGSSSGAFDLAKVRERAR